MPRAEMLERMSSEELTGWMTFARLEPFGSEAGYIGHAITAATVANVNRGKDKQAYEIEEFMPQFEKKEQGVDQMINMAAIITASLGGKDLRTVEEIPDLDDEDL